MNIVILNDTFSWYHWGCTASSSGIREELQGRAHKLTYCHILDTYNFKNIPTVLADFDSKEFFFNVVLTNNQQLFAEISDADLILINGEGTIHYLSKPAVALLYISYASKKYLNKVVHIINHSPYPISRTKQNKNLVNQLYKGVYSVIDFVAIREHISKNMMDRLNIKSVLSFDCLPIAANKYMQSPYPSDTTVKFVVIANSVSFEQSKIHELVHVMKTLNHEGYSIRILIGAKAHPALDTHKFLSWLEPFREEINWEVVDAKSLNEWFSVIQSAKLLISGRFHHTIAAYFLGTPFVLMESNTPKNIALSESFNAPAPVGYDSDNFGDKLLRRIKDALSANNTNNQNIINGLSERAKLNFAGISS